MLAPAEEKETNTETVMDNFKKNKFQNFRHRLGPENGNVRLRPDTSENYEGFTWTKSKFNCMSVNFIASRKMLQFFQFVITKAYIIVPSQILKNPSHYLTLPTLAKITLLTKLN